jgi:hypothetical protein
MEGAFEKKETEAWRRDWPGLKRPFLAVRTRTGS